MADVVWFGTAFLISKIYSCELHAEKTRTQIQIDREIIVKFLEYKPLPPDEAAGWVYSRLQQFKQQKKREKKQQKKISNTRPMFEFWNFQGIWRLVKNI